VVPLDGGVPQEIEFPAGARLIAPDYEGRQFAFSLGTTESEVRVIDLKRLAAVDRR
jgi:hypothetical protein